MPYNVRIVSTYPPRRCGIGTFSRDLANALEHFPGEVGSIRVAAIDREGLPYAIPVDLVIDQYDPQSWQCIFWLGSKSTFPKRQTHTSQRRKLLKRAWASILTRDLRPRIVLPRILNVSPDRLNRRGNILRISVPPRRKQSPRTCPPHWVRSHRGR